MSKIRTRQLIITLTAALLLVAVAPASALAGSAGIEKVSPKYNEKIPYASDGIWPNFEIIPDGGVIPKRVVIANDSGLQEVTRQGKCRQDRYTDAGIVWVCGGPANLYAYDWRNGTQLNQKRPLDANKTYWWHVVVERVDDPSEQWGTPHHTRPLVTQKKIADKPISAIGNEAMATATCALNCGKAAYAKSKIGVRSIRSKKVGKYRFRIEVKVRNRKKVDIRKSKPFVVVKGPGGTKRLRLKYMPGKANYLYANWTRPKKSRKKSGARHTYQAFMKSKVNNARIKSEQRVILFKDKKKKPIRTIGAYGLGGTYGGLYGSAFY